MFGTEYLDSNSQDLLKYFSSLKYAIQFEHF
jgi:hypothetical protein